MIVIFEDHLVHPPSLHHLFVRARKNSPEPNHAFAKWVAARASEPDESGEG